MNLYEHQSNQSGSEEPMFKQYQKKQLYAENLAA